jgi:histidinol-phosphate aminotransferase
MNLKKIIRSNIMGLQPYASARDDFKTGDGDTVFLDANESPYDNGLNRYPDPQQIKLKSLISDRDGISIQNMLLGNGSDEVLDLIFRVFCEPNVDNIIILPPTYGMYGVLANINAVDIIEVPLNDNFQPEVNRIMQALDTRSKLLFICSPNNPSGNSFEPSRIEELLNSFGGIVVIDEAYIDFSGQESWAKRLNEFPNLIVTQTLSKAYGMAGIRLGICYASREIITLLNKIKPPYNVSELTQRQAISLLSNPRNIASQIKNILDERYALVRDLATIPFIKTIYPTDANFLLVKLDDADKRYDQLIKQGVVVRNRSNQPLCKNCLRITVGTSEENKKLLTALKNIR